MRHIISVLLENEPGALSRVVGLFSQRNYNIESLTVAPTEDSTLSRLTVTTTGDDRVVEQITKQLNKLIDVVKVASSFPPMGGPTGLHSRTSTLRIWRVSRRRCRRCFLSCSHKPVLLVLARK